MRRGSEAEAVEYLGRLEARPIVMSELKQLMGGTQLMNVIGVCSRK